MSELLTIVKMKDLISYSFQMTDDPKRYPKKVRFSVTNRIQDNVLDSITLMYEANEMDVPDRRKSQEKILTNIRVLLYLIEFSLSRHYIDERQMGIWVSKVNDVKNLTAAWMHRT